MRQLLMNPKNETLNLLHGLRKGKVDYDLDLS